MENIKKSFKKVKQDIDSLKQEVIFLKLNLIETREKIIEVCDIVKKMHKKIKKQQTKKFVLTNNDNNDFIETSTNNPLIPTSSTHLSTHNLSLEGLKNQNLPFSNGNEGVSTDRQTDRQTDKKRENNLLNNKNSMENALKILNSLDHIKKEIRLKFKRLTNQELLVFSSIYQLEEEIGHPDYKTLSQKLNLTESSIRDYVGRLIKKGIPVEKNKINNKNIELSISKTFKKVATLSTILQLREL